MYARSFGEISLGLYGTDYTPDETSAFDEDDRLFSLGNGTANNSRSNALVIYKSGDTELNGTLNITGEASGGSDFIVTIDNTKFAGETSIGARANGVLIRAGQDTGTNQSPYMIAFERPDGTQIGSIVETGSHSNVSYNTTSDIRLKANIQPTRYALADILGIQVSDYYYKSDNLKTPQTGFLAQQLNEVFPVAVTEGGEDAKTNPWTVDYSKLTPLLVKGIQDQQEIIEGQQTEIETLKAEVEALKAKNGNLQTQLAEENTALKARLERIEAMLGAKAKK